MALRSGPNVIQLISRSRFLKSSKTSTHSSAVFLADTVTISTHWSRCPPDETKLRPSLQLFSTFTLGSEVGHHSQQCNLKSKHYATTCVPISFQKSIANWYKIYFVKDVL